MKTICVYCGSRAGSTPRYLEYAEALGDALVRRDIGLVYGGASIGLMGKIADSVLAGGGRVTGVMPESLFRDEVAHAGLTQLITVDNMHQRKQKMADLSDGFIAMPGGFGTLEEVFEAITWSQLRIHVKPIGLYNVDGYYDALDRFIGYAVDQGFIRPRHKQLYVMDPDPDALIDAMSNMQSVDESRLSEMG